MIWNQILTLLFPARCTICDRVLSYGKEGICEDCEERLEYLTQPLCGKCGKKIGTEEEFCYDCSRKTHWFTRGVAVFPYSYVRSSLYRFKYAGRAEFARFYARQMDLYLGQQRIRWRPQALVPVPLHKKKRRLRGYNQAELVAKELSKLWGIPVMDNLVVRVKNTRPMKEIDGTKRQNNLKKAFKLGKNDVKLNTIIIIDDIYTTGSTVDAVAKVCREAGIETIYVLCISIGHGL